MARANYKERADGDFTPYKYFSKVNQIEDYIWNYNYTTAAFSEASLQDHYQYASALGEVLRSKSLYRGDLSDLCDFKFKQKLKPNEYHIGIQRTGTGKANADQVLYSRVMWHKDPELCFIGSLALYFLARFELNDEIEHMDFGEN